MIQYQKAIANGTRSIYLIIDNLAISRIDSEIKNFIINEMILIKEGSDVKNQWSGVKLYKCQQKTL